jgi:precorrin isomerase
MTPRSLIVQTYVLQAVHALLGAGAVALAIGALQERRPILASIDMVCAGLNAIFFVRQANVRATWRQHRRF